MHDAKSTIGYQFVMSKFTHCKVLKVIIFTVSKSFKAVVLKLDHDICGLSDLLELLLLLAALAIRGLQGKIM